MASEYLRFGFDERAKSARSSWFTLDLCSCVRSDLTLKLEYTLKMYCKQKELARIELKTRLIPPQVSTPTTSVNYQPHPWFQHSYEIIGRSKIKLSKKLQLVELVVHKINTTLKLLHCYLKTGLFREEFSSLFFFFGSEIKPCILNSNECAFWISLY